MAATTIGDNDLHWGLTAETNLRIQSLNIERSVKHEELVEDENGADVGAGFCGVTINADMQGTLRSTGPTWTLAASSTLANATRLSAHGATIVTTICTKASTAYKNNGFATESFSFRCFTF